LLGEQILSNETFFQEENRAKATTRFSWDIFQKSFRRLSRYLIVRILTIMLAVGVGLYLTLLVLNLGGYVDTIQEGQITEMIGGMAFSGAFDDIPPEERVEYIEELRQQIEESMGLHQPLAVRTARWWFNGVTLQWGNAERLASLDQKSRLARDVIFERIPFTLLLVGGANFILFFLSLWLAMLLSKNQGKFWDRFLSSMTPISSIPSWIHGVILLAIFALELNILPFKGMFDGAPPADPVQYALQILKHMILPVTAVVLSVFFQGVYTWRTFFLVHAGEDYVELAEAKGLPDRIIRNRYILRPTLPSIITSFAMMIISFWEGAIALEILFNWSGLGALFMRAIRLVDRPVVVGIVVMFAYLMGVTVLLLDIIYALVDPRVRIGKNGGRVREKAYQKGGFKRFLKGIFKREDENRWKKSLKGYFDIDSEAVDSPENSITTSQSDGYFKTMLRTVGRNIFKYPLAAVGLLVIFILFIVAVGTVIAYPYEEAVDYWHGEHWMEAPRLARPVWFNLFREEKLPHSVFFDSTQDTQNGIMDNQELGGSENMQEVQLSFDFEFIGDVFPQDLIFSFFIEFKEKAPFSVVTLITPDGREMELKKGRVIDRMQFALSDEDYDRVHKQKEFSAIQKVFGDPDLNLSRPLEGTYQLKIYSYLFEEGSTVDVKGVLHGQVYGLFGTDTHRRNLTVAMLWGTPVVLTFALMGALVTAISILLAAISAWYGGFLDEILQRITEINITIPTIMIAVMVYILYSQSIWVIMTAIILMNVFGNALKEYRAMFIQLREAPYIEAAKAYGTKNLRIIFQYMFPRIIPVMIPNLVIAIPGFVFLEATLAFLGVIPPYLPTWGKVINQALNEGTFQGHYFWVLEPITLALITGLAFAFVGFALDKILNPRLRNL
jgi:ABC-type dipeptide/oligopeptide/nickel transport system permease component